MKIKPVTDVEKQLSLEIQTLNTRLKEAEETLYAIRTGEVDAIVVQGSGGEVIYSLTSSETPYRILVEVMNEGVATLSTDGTILYCNHRFAELVNVPHEQAIGASFIQFIAKMEQPKFDKLLKCSIVEKCEGEIRFKTLDRHMLVFHLSFSPFPPGLLGNVCVIIRDITELKKNEELVRESEKRMKEAQHIALVGNWDWNLKTNEMYWSDESNHIFGFPSDMQTSVESFQAAIDPFDQEFVNQSLEEALKGRSPYDIYFHIILPDGQKKIVHAIGEVTRNNSGIPIRMFGTVQDTTKLKQAEEALYKSDFRLKLALESSHAGAWDLCLLDHSSERSLVHDQIFGYKTLLPYWSYELFLEHVLPEDREEVDRKFRKAVATNSECSFDCRIRRVDGAVRWIFATGGHLFDAKGKSVRMSGIVQDITERKQEEMKYRKNERRIKAILNIFQSPRNQIIDMANNELVNLTESNLAFIGLVDEDQETMHTHLWTEAAKQKNPSEQKPLEFPIENTGIWHKSIRQKEVIMVNDYTEPRTQQMDLLFGHVPLSRLLVVPVIRNGCTVMIGIVANKADPYCKDDVFQIRIIVEGLWERMKILHAEEALKESDIKLLHAQHVAHIGYWELDLNTHKLTWSDEIYHIFELNPSKSRATYEVFLGVIHPEDKEMVSNALKYSFETHTQYELDHRLLMPDGRVKYVHQYYETFYDDGGLPLRNIGIVQDISWRKHLENLLNKKNEELTRLNTDKDRFMSILAHDLKSPFNSILGFLDLLSSEIDTYEIDEIQRQLNIVNTSVKQFYNLLEDLLMWTRSQSGKLTFEPEEMHLKDICQDILSGLKLNADSKNITIYDFVAADLDVYADIDMLKTILRNLVSNAIKFTHPGGRIDINTKQSSKEATISISDNGVGIAPEVIDNLFDITQFHSTKGTINEDGTGLGLLLCKEFVEKHGGEIWLKSTLRKGSTFYFTIPCKLKIIKESADENKVLDEIATKKKKLKILIADDDESSEVLLEAVISKIGKDILSVKDGFEAVQACINHPDLDLVLMDIRMPGMDGYEAVRQIRLFNKEVVIIAQTAFVLSEDRNKALAAGCNDYISKPIKKNKLMAVIHEHFQY